MMATSDGLPDDVRAALRELLARSLRDEPFELAPRETPLAPERADLLRSLLAHALAPEHAPPHAPRAGHAFGPYRIVERDVDEDGGTRFRAERLWPRETVILHVVNAPIGNEGGQVRRRFDLEIDALISLSHPHLEPLLDAGYVGTCRFTATREPRGLALRDWMDRERVSTPETFESRTLTVLRKLIDALETLHEAGVTHRALRPEHLHIEANDTPRLSGVARIAPREPLPADHPLPYRAPEHFRDDLGGRDHRTDLYQLGLLLHELLDGRPALRGPTRSLERRARLAAFPPPRHTDTATGRGLAAIAARLLAFHTRDRYANARAVRMDLEALLRGRAIDTRPVGYGHALWRRVRSVGLGGPWG